MRVLLSAMSGSVNVAKSTGGVRLGGPEARGGKIHQWETAASWQKHRTAAPSSCQVGVSNDR